MTATTQAAVPRREALSYGWQIMKDNLALFIPLGLLSWLVSGTIGALQRSGGGHGLLVLGLQLVNVALAMGWARICLRLHDQQPASLADVLEVTPARYLDYLITAALFGLLVGVGLVLLIVPGVLWGVTYCLAPLLVVDQGLTPRAALRRSAELTHGVREELLVFWLMIIGVNILGALALGVGLLATAPASAMAAVYVYRRLLARATGLRDAHHGGAFTEHPATA